MLLRQRVILALLEQLGGTVGRTVLVKLAFLLRHETAVGAAGTFYDFVPYKYGPFSFTLYHELQAMERDGYVTSTEDTLGLREDARQLARREVEGLTWQGLSAVKHVVATYGRMTKESLLKDVYARYPWFATRTELTELVQAAPPTETTVDIAVYTIGYEGRSVDDFFEHLMRSRIEAILDVRANPVSRKYGFAKRSMSETAEKLGFGYRHLPSLGIPSELREDLFNFASFQRLLDEYEKETLPQRTAEIGQLIQFLKERPSVLVCVENDVQCCHRGRLAQAVSRRSGLAVKHL